MSETKICPVCGEKQPCTFLTKRRGGRYKKPDNFELLFLRNRETGFSKKFKIDYGTRHILTHNMFKECPITSTDMNKVFCSEWLNDRQVVFGTRCRKLMTFDVITKRFDQINSTTNTTDQQIGIHSLQINPSRTLLATGAANTSNDIAIYRLPTLEPICVEEGVHRDWVFDVCWVDDQLLVSGSRDTKIALWKIEDPCCNDIPVTPIATKECKAASKVRAFAFNKVSREIAAISLNSYIAVWSAETFQHKISRKLPCQCNICIASRDNGSIYSVGCSSCTVLLDSRTLQAVKKISSRYSGCGVRSVSFQGDVLTIGTDLGMIMFYDLRAGKYLESSISYGRSVVLKSSGGYALSDEEGFHQVKYTPSIYTHCYDFSGTRLFSAGGPLPANLYGNYVGLWQ